MIAEGHETAWSGDAGNGGGGSKTSEEMPGKTSERIWGHAKVQGRERLGLMRV